MKQDRLDNVLHQMKEKNVPQLLISDPTTIFYLTDKWFHPGERLLVLVIREDGKHALVLNKLFPVNEDLGVDVVYVDDADNGIGILLEHLDTAKKIGVDKFWATHFFLDLMKQAGKSADDFVIGSEITDYVRARKTAEEVKLMQDAQKDNEIAMEKMKQLIPQKLTEMEMTKELAKVYDELGNTGFSFEPIIAYGANGADPHHVTDDSVVKEGDSIVVDIGAIKNNYASDMTRTFFYKSVSDKSRDVYETVLEANKRALAAIKPGVPFSEIDAAARDYITEKGYGEYFTHRTGHFIGIECHEAGDVSSANQDVVEPGMAFSIEPGIYLPGEVGVRIEDLVIATEDGYINLNDYPKELTIID